MYLTNTDEAPESVAARYDGGAGIETMIAEWKNEWGIAETPSWHFRANYAALLIKMLSFNLLRRFVRFAAPKLVIWRADWVRRALLCVAGLLVRSGRWTSIAVMPTTALYAITRPRE